MLSFLVYAGCHHEQKNNWLPYFSALHGTVQVLRGGMYDVAAIYSSSRQAPFKLSVGMYRDIKAQRTLALRVQLPAQV
jgi:hypothetical protein